MGDRPLACQIRTRWSLYVCLVSLSCSVSPSLPFAPSYARPLSPEPSFPRSLARYRTHQAQHSLQLGQQGKEPSPESSLSSYDQQILANGPPIAGTQTAAGLPQGPTPYGSAAHATNAYVYPYPKGGQMPMTQDMMGAQLPPAHVASIYTTTYTSAAAAGEAAAERAVAKMQAKALPNPFAPLQQMQQNGVKPTAADQGIFANIASMKPGPPPFSIPPAPQYSPDYVKALPFTQNGGVAASVVASQLTPTEEGKVAVHLTKAANALNPALSDSVAMAKKLAKDAARARRVRLALAREAARAVKAEQAATLGGMSDQEGVNGGGPPVVSRGMSVIFVTLTIAAILGVIWYVRKPETRQGTRTDDLFAQTSQQYV